jgi:hypothetical protein
MIGVVSQVIYEPKCAYHPDNQSHIRSGHHLVDGLEGDTSSMALVLQKTQLPKFYIKH